MPIQYQGNTPGNNINNDLFLLIVSLYQRKGMYDTTLHGMEDILRTFVVNLLEFPQQNRRFMELNPV